MSQRSFQEIIFQAEILNAALRKEIVDSLRVRFLLHDAILGMGMNNIVLQDMNRFHRILIRYHHQIGRIQVDPDSAGRKTVQKSLQHGGLLRTGFDGKMGSHFIPILPHGTEGILQDPVLVLTGV